jgi:polysaccharide pyruvyl transferase WcaK-like protein
MARLRIAHVHFRTRHNAGDAAVLLAIRQLLDGPLQRPRWTSIRLRELAPPARPGLVQRLNRHDLVIVGGGGLYSRWGLPLDPAALNAIEVPVVVVGAGLNRNLGDPPLSVAQLDSIRLLHERASLASVRDSASQRLLADLGFQVALTGDPALWLAPRRPWLLSPALGRPAPGPRIGFNLAAHGWAGQAEYLERVLAACVPVLREQVDGHRAQLVYLVHSDAERRLLPRLRAALPGLYAFRASPAGLRWMYGQLDLVISMMLHSSILAAAAGTPVINLAYDDKNLAFMQDVGCTGWQLSADAAGPEVLGALVRRALSAGSSAAADPAVLAALRASTDCFIARLAALAGR